MSKGLGLPWLVGLRARRAPTFASAPNDGQGRGHATVGDFDAASIALDAAVLGIAYAVHEIVYPESGADWPQHLEELGFLPGERVMVKARALPGGDPLSVRVGHSTFALRRAEAACVRVRPWPADDR
jgi:ferrous iron transport protein A